MPVALIILAAGQGTRMNSDLPKVLHQIGGAPMFVHALEAGRMLEAERRVLVVGHGAQAVSAAARAYDPDIEIVVQDEQLGTGHAVNAAREALADFDGDVVVLYGDTPFIRPETLQAMVDARSEFDVVVLGFEAADPGRYGRLIMDGKNLNAIVEAKDADNAELAVTFCNSGVKMTSGANLFALLDTIGNDNASGEYYLTDIVAAAAKTGQSATAIACDETETLGVNSRADLARAEAVFQARARSDAQENGVTLVAP